MFRGPGVARVNTNSLQPRDTRTVQNDLTISVDGERWQLHSGVRSGEHVELRTRLDASVHLYKKDKELEYHRIKRLANVASG